MSWGRSFPAWAWVGCGCLGALGAMAFAVVAVGFWGARKARQFGEEIRDPAARTEKVLSAMGASEIPAGYHAVVAFSVPFLLDVAMLSDLPPDEGGGPPRMGEHGFIYVSYASFGQDQAKVRDYFEGRTDRLEQLRSQRIDLELTERIANGRFPRRNDEILWVSHRGTLEMDDGQRSREGFITTLLADCRDSRNRIGIWFGPDPEPEAPVPDLDLAGTVSDPDAIADFLSTIHPCR